MVVQLKLSSSASSSHLSGTRHNSLSVSWQASECIRITSPSETKAGPPVSLGTWVTLRLSRPVRREEWPVKQAHFISALARQIHCPVPKCPCFHITIGIKWALLIWKEEEEEEEVGSGNQSLWLAQADYLGHTLLCLIKNSGWRGLLQSQG